MDWIGLNEVGGEPGIEGSQRLPPPSRSIPAHSDFRLYSRNPVASIG